MDYEDADRHHVPRMRRMNKVESGSDQGSPRARVVHNHQGLRVHKSGVQQPPGQPKSKRPPRPSKTAIKVHVVLRVQGLKNVNPLPKEELFQEHQPFAKGSLTEELRKLEELRGQGVQSQQKNKGARSD